MALREQQRSEKKDVIYFFFLVPFTLLTIWRNEVGRKGYKSEQ